MTELCKSDTADRLEINNTPSKEIEKHLNVLIDFLNGLRELWGGPIRVNSGFRCKELNEAVGGSKTSAHMEGWAADIVNVNGSYYQFKQCVLEYLKDKKFDQCILERSRTSEWVHIGLYNREGKQRGQIFKMSV